MPIGKASLRQMGIRPWREVQPDVPPELIGIILSTYFGGRSEVRLRKQLEPLNPDWLTVISPGHSSMNQPPEVREAIRDMNQADFFDRDLMRDRNTFERSFFQRASTTTLPGPPTSVPRSTPLRSSYRSWSWNGLVSRWTMPVALRWSC
jgi:hypothetical protein